MKIVPLFFHSLPKISMKPQVHFLRKEIQNIPYRKNKLNIYPINKSEYKIWDLKKLKRKLKSKA